MIMNPFILLFLLLILISTAVYLGRKFHPLTFLLSLLMIILLYAGWKSYNSSFTFTNQLYKLMDNPVNYTVSLFQDQLQASNHPIKDEVLLDVPIVKQLPELPRGCEVTSLAMLLQYAGIHAEKLTLAEQLKKNPSQMKKINGQVYYGDPNDGFIGDMYSTNKPGLGVYHTPIKELAERYMPGRIIDFSNSDFKQIKKHLSTNRPIWIIINTAYQKLDPSYFHTWVTPNGKISITYKEHSVVVTGYDQDYIYFNDPLTGIKNKRAPAAEFEKAWVQMGKQAITYKD
jgi:uncharacterized protein YvpB